MNYSYTDIQKYLVNHEISGKQIHCEFQTSNGEIYEATAPIKMSKSIGNKVQQEVARVAKQQARRQTNRLIRSALGGTMGRIGSRVARGALSDMGSGGSQGSYTASDKEDAIVKAFQKVSRHFESKRSTERIKIERPERGERRERRERPERGERRGRDRSDRRGGGGQSRRSDSDYQNQISDAPISNPFEQELLARFLVALASADGRITADEREFLSEVIPSKFGTIEDLQGKDAISRIEAEELDADIRETVLVLGWSMALADYDLDSSEIRLLSTYGISDHRKEELATMAKKECLENAITAETSREELFNLADGIDLDRDNAERCMISYKKKMY